MLSLPLSDLNPPRPLSLVRLHSENPDLLCATIPAALCSWLIGFRAELINTEVIHPLSLTQY